MSLPPCPRAVKLCFTDAWCVRQGGGLWAGRGPRVGVRGAVHHERSRQVTTFLQRVLVRTPTPASASPCPCRHNPADVAGRCACFCSEFTCEPRPHLHHSCPREQSALLSCLVIVRLVRCMATTLCYQFISRRARQTRSGAWKPSYQHSPLVVKGKHSWADGHQCSQLCGRARGRLLHWATSRPHNLISESGVTGAVVMITW